MVVLKRAALYRFEMPWRLGSLRTGLFILLQVDNAHAWGECSPLPGFHPLDLETAAAQLVGWAEAWVAGELLDVDGPVGFAVQGALNKLQGPQLPKNIQVTQLVMRDGDDQHLASPPAIKVKLGPDPVAAESCLSGLRRRFPDVSLRVDGNRSWPHGHGLIPILMDAGVEVVEDPLQDWSQLPGLAEHFSVAVDETLRDQPSVVSEDWVRVVVLKPELVGWHACTSLARQARDLGKTIVYSSCLGTPVSVVDLMTMVEDPNVPQGFGTLDHVSWQDVVQWDRKGWPVPRPEALIRVWSSDGAA